MIPADPDRDTHGAELIRHQEELLIDKQPVDAGGVRVRTHLDTEAVSEPVERGVEALDRLDHVDPDTEDSGQVETLPDESVSIPIFEEQFVITKRFVVRERVIIRRRVTPNNTSSKQLRRERVSIDRDAEEPSSPPSSPSDESYADDPRTPTPDANGGAFVVKAG